MNNKLNELFNSLTYTDINRLGEFVRSPFHNKSKIMISVYTYIKKQKKLGIDKLDTKELYSNIYPKNNFSNVRARLITSDFTKIIEEFLKLTAASDNIYCMNYGLLENLRRKGAGKSFSMHLKKISKQFGNNKALDVDEYCFLGKVESSYAMFNINNLKLSNKKITYDRSMEYYQLLFVLITIRGANLQRLIQTQWNENNQINRFLLGNVIQYVSANLKYFKKCHGVIYIEYLINSMFNDCNNYLIHEKVFRALKNMYSELCFEQLGHIFFSFNAQFVMATYNAVNVIFHTEKLFNVIKYYDKAGFFDTHRIITPEIFFNIVSITSIVDPLFSKKFIEKYQNKLEKSTKEDFLYLSKAVVFIIEKKYSDAISELNKIEMVNFQIYLISKTYLARVYYLTNEYESLLYLIDASKHFLFRHKLLLGLRYEKFKSFFNYLLKISKVKEKGPDMMLQYRSEIRMQSNFVGRNWLLEIIDNQMNRQ